MEPVPGWGTIPRMLRELVAGHPGALVVAGRDGVRLTLAELFLRAGEVARGLLALGVERGDRVALWGLNTPGWVVSAFAVWDAGAVVVPLSTRYKGLEAAETLRRTGATVLITGERMPGAPPYADLLDAGLRRLARTPDELAELGAVVGERALEERAAEVKASDLCEIMSTSGTTGTPKGVMLDHAQVLRGYWDWSEIVTLREGDRYPVIAPFAHGFGLNAGLLACVMRRATMMPVPVFSPDALMELIAGDGITILAGAPPMFQRLLDELDREPGREVALRVAICGAAAVPPELVRRLLDRVGLERMINAYGLMEGTVVSMTRAGDPVEVIASTTGRPVPGIEVRVVDDEGRDVPVGERGEVLERGYGVMRGYWGEPEKTAEVVDADGWLHTGDVGVLDAAGNLAIVDRKKDLFIVNGFNVSPAEVESLLLREGSLAAAAVIGMPDARRGESGWAYVVPRPGAEVTPESVIAWAKANMSGYKVPARVYVVDALPVNPNGKVDKRELRARAASAG
ncbi:AMP-binding protein [Bailinhaonella thermotolerans]|uniref:AMP-dependent synthetase n=1 Tax=Bailinhaonella thermotolerans TaxID=1070861 RepID=A0A3A4ALB8_9ACTN|nr:AMP-binding protein [Bailinhaonella thermotolerans]RJL26583.1 AMP-dependent synthetase [Bailinhaonella thermotolerans]